jgi:small-conductance mechanosensitive channel
LHVLDSHIRLDFRKAIFYGLLALAALITGHDIGGVHARSFDIRLAAYGCALAVAVFGLAASRTAAREVQRATVARAGDTAATPLRLAALLVGYLITVIAVCDLTGVNLRQILLGGAITGIILGLAAQPILSNLFAGLVLLFARPYVPGQKIRVLSGSINGPHIGRIVAAGLLYTLLETADGPLNIPNSTLLSAAVGPAPVDAQEPSPAPAPGIPPAGQDAATAATVIGDAELGSRQPHRG